MVVVVMLDGKLVVLAGRERRVARRVRAGALAFVIGAGAVPVRESDVTFHGEPEAEVQQSGKGAARVAGKEAAEAVVEFGLAQRRGADRHVDQDPGACHGLPVAAAVVGTDEVGIGTAAAEEIRTRARGYVLYQLCEQQRRGVAECQAEPAGVPFPDLAGVEAAIEEEVAVDCEMWEEDERDDRDEQGRDDEADDDEDGGRDGGFVVGVGDAEVGEGEGSVCWTDV